MKDPRLVALGQHIRHTRKAQGHSQEDLAAIAQLDRSYMGRIERGEQNITLLTLYQLADALSVSPAALIPTEEPSNK